MAQYSSSDLSALAAEAQKKRARSERWSNAGELQSSPELLFYDFNQHFSPGPSHTDYAVGVSQLYYTVKWI